MRVSDFHFDLPEELIAQHPPKERGSSRMLVLDRATGAVRDEQFRNLPELLRAGDLLVLNDSRVLPARLFATRGGLDTQVRSPAPSGVVEVLLTEEVGENLWRALVKPAKKVRVGETLHFRGVRETSKAKDPGLKPQGLESDYRGLKPSATPKSRNGASFQHLLESAATPGGDSEPPPPVLTAEVLEAGEFGERTLRFAAVEDFYERVGRIGHMPLPPYIRRDQAGHADSEEDRERYQTVYSQRVGSAAAPTAGLHFTAEILAELELRGVEVRYVTLHVGLGTFQPVRVDRLEDIRLHAERYTLPEATAEALNRALAEGRRVVAVGTTTTRVLEHIAAITDEEPIPGAKAPVDFEPVMPGLKSRPISSGTEFSCKSSGPESSGGQSGIESSGGQSGMESSLGSSRKQALFGRVEAHSGATSIFIGPGHRFRVVSGLLTNFHLPESTLVMLVSAFAGRERVLGAYEHAIQKGYRFYSYGDCMLVV